jgi:hypothetical protein
MNYFVEWYWVITMILFLLIDVIILHRPGWSDFTKINVAVMGIMLSSMIVVIQVSLCVAGYSGLKPTVVVVLTWAMICCSSSVWIVSLVGGKKNESHT